jgi:hypothetical protein
MNVDPSIKAYFVYGELDYPLFEYDDSSDLVFNDVKEHPQLNIEKTLKAMEYIDSHIEYDFFIRTNLSTFWNFHKLHSYLNELPNENCYSGVGPYGGYYLGGVDTIVTPDMIKSIISNKHLIDYLVCEDQAMGKYFHGYLKAPMLPNSICVFEDITNENNIDLIMTRIKQSFENNVNHYRVKSRYNRETIDFFIYKILLKTIYNIDY